MKIVFVSGMLPSGHYSQYITSGLASCKNIELLVYTDTNPKNLEVRGCGTIKPVWTKSLKFIYEIVTEVRKDNPDIVHLQHELNMYGGMLTAALFPVLVLSLRLLGKTVVVTVHAGVYKRQIDARFVETFHQNAKIFRPVFLKIFFHFVYKFISLFSSHMIVHTHLKKDILTKDYGVNGNKVTVVPAAIPSKTIDNTHKQHYFFYFGYMVRRKGLGYALDGFKKFVERNPESDFKFILAGGVIKGQEEAYEEIKRMASATGLKDRIVLRGFIEESEQDALYGNAYVVVIPAVLSMGYSGPMYHAESYGKCIIATKIGHYIEILEDGVSGILTENDKWAEAFEFVVNNPKKVTDIEHNISKRAANRSPENTAKEYIKLYKNLLEIN